MDNVKDFFDKTFTDTIYHIGMLRAYLTIVAKQYADAADAEKHLEDYDNAMWSMRNNCATRWIFGGCTRFEEWSKKDLKKMDVALVCLAKKVVDTEMEAIDRVVDEQEVLLSDAMTLTALRECKKSMGCLHDSLNAYHDVYERVLKGGK